MIDNDTVKAGDTLMCISNSGLCSMGDTEIIMGLTEKSINMSGSTTGWTSRNNFRWHNFKHYPCDVIPEEVIKFAEITEKIVSNNKVLLSKQAKLLNSRK